MLARSTKVTPNHITVHTQSDTMRKMRRIADVYNIPGGPVVVVPNKRYVLSEDERSAALSFAHMNYGRTPLLAEPPKPGAKAIAELWRLYRLEDLR